MVLQFSDLVPSRYAIRDLPARSINNDQKKIGGDGDDDEEEMELSRKKRAKKKDSETEADSSSSDYSCFVALVTASNLHEDALYLPKDFSSSSDFKRECRKIVLTNGGERAWELDLSFNKSSDTFYISRGWRSFCDENRKDAGALFVFKLVGKGEMPLLSFCPTESKGEKTSEKESLPVEPSSGQQISEEEIKKNYLRCRDSTPPSQNRFVTLTLTHDTVRYSRQHLPSSFIKENGLEKPGVITLLGEDGTTWLAYLRREACGKMYLGKGWIFFARGNGIKIGDSFTLESIWKDTTPMLSLLNTESTTDTRQQGEFYPKSIEKESLLVEPSMFNAGYISTKKHQRPRTEEAAGDDDQEDMELSRKKKAKKENSKTEADSSPSDHSRFVALVTASNLNEDALYLPKDFSSSSGLQRECRKIVLTNGGERAWALDLSFNKSSNTFYISRGWRSFCDENRKEVGALFVFKLVGKGEMPLLSFCPTESKGEKTSEKESLPVEFSSGQKISEEEIKKNYLRCRDSTPPSQNRFVTLTLAHDTVRYSRQRLPLAFMRENGMDKPGMITLLGKDGTKWLANLRQERTKRMCLGMGWRNFATANGLKAGESFTLESIWENGTPMLSLVSTYSTPNIRQQGEYCSKASAKEHVSTEPNSGNNTRRAENSREEIRESSSAIENRFVTLTLTLEDVRDCILILPSQFMKANGINKLGKIIFLGKKHRMKWFAYLLSKDGIVALGYGWKGFCEANGVKTGESFTLEFLDEQNTTPVFEFCPQVFL